MESASICAQEPLIHSGKSRVRITSHQSPVSVNPVDTRRNSDKNVIRSNIISFAGFRWPQITNLQFDSKSSPIHHLDLLSFIKPICFLV